MTPSSVRADAWTWAVRLYKTRTQATAACKAGHVRVNGEKAKPATPVHIGDRVVVRLVVDFRRPRLADIGGEDDDASLGEAGLPQFARQLPAAHARQFYIEDERFRFECLQQRQPFFGIWRILDIKAACF